MEPALSYKKKRGKKREIEIIEGNSNQHKKKVTEKKKTEIDDK